MNPRPAASLVLGGALLAVAGVVAGAVVVPQVLQVDEPPTSRTAPDAVPDAPAAPHSEPRRKREQEGIRLASGDFVVGTWEDGTVLGEPLVVGHREGHEHIVYAARADVAGGETSVATGLRDGSRILRLVPALRPEVPRHQDGIDLHGGNRLDGALRPDTGLAGPSYLLLGSVPGEVQVTVADPGGTARPVTAWSTSMLPGYTIFYDIGPWRPGWDQVLLAPLTVITDDGRHVQVRERSWTG